MTEAALQRRVRELLELKGWFPLESDRAAMGRWSRRGGFEVGFPDLLALRGTEFLLIELKTATGKVRPEQRALHARFLALGIQVEVCRSEEDVLAVLAQRERRQDAAPVAVGYHP